MYIIHSAAVSQSEWFIVIQWTSMGVCWYDWYGCSVCWTTTVYVVPWVKSEKQWLVCRLTLSFVGFRKNILAKVIFLIPQNSMLDSSQSTIVMVVRVYAEARKNIILRFTVVKTLQKAFVSWKCARYTKSYHIWDLMLFCLLMIVLYVLSVFNIFYFISLLIFLPYTLFVTWLVNFTFITKETREANFFTMITFYHHDTHRTVPVG